MPSNPAGLVYGTISVAALLAAESTRQETFARTVAAVSLTMLLYWLAHAYAEFTGERLESEQPFTYRGLAEFALRGLWVLLGAAAPLLVLLGCWALDTTLATGVTAGIWTAVVALIVLEVSIGLRARLETKELIGQTAVGVLLGLLVLAVRVLLH